MDHKRSLNIGFLLLNTSIKNIIQKCTDVYSLISGSLILSNNVEVLREIALEYSQIKVPTLSSICHMRWQYIYESLKHLLLNRIVVLVTLVNIKNDVYTGLGKPTKKKGIALHKVLSKLHFWIVITCILDTLHGLNESFNIKSTNLSEYIDSVIKWRQELVMYMFLFYLLYLYIIYCVFIYYILCIYILYIVYLIHR